MGETKMTNLHSYSLSDLLNMQRIGDESYYECQPVDAQIEELQGRLTKINDNWPDVMAVERLTAENERLMLDIETGSAEIKRLRGEIRKLAHPKAAEIILGSAVEPTREPVIPFVHWSKDPLVPYPGCACASCSSLDHQAEPTRNARVVDAYTDGTPIPVLGLAEMRALPPPSEYDSGIYFLWAGEQLLYIGKSRNLCTRENYQSNLKRLGAFHTSTRAKPIPYDAMTCLVLENGIECSRELDANLRNYERAYIAAYRTPFNEDELNGFT